MAKPIPPRVGEPFIKARGLSMRYPLGSAYQNVDLDIAFGQFCAIVANGGEGKTELLLTLAGRMRPTAGTLTVAGWDLPRKRGKVSRISGMGFFHLVNDVQPALTVESVAAAELNLHSMRSGRQAVAAFLASWGLEGVARCRIESLDRVSYVRLGIALGLVGNPWLLVVDDVESELTSHQSAQMMRELASIAHVRGMTVIVACADYELARLADAAVPISEAAREQRRMVEEAHQAGRARALTWARSVYAHERVDARVKPQPVVQLKSESKQERQGSDGPSDEVMSHA